MVSMWFSVVFSIILLVLLQLQYLARVRFGSFKMCQVYLSLFCCICLPILMHLDIMLYIILAYLMLFTALFNAVCLCNAYLFLAIAIYIYALSFGY